MSRAENLKHNKSQDPFLEHICYSENISEYDYRLKSVILATHKSIKDHHMTFFKGLFFILLFSLVAQTTTAQETVILRGKVLNDSIETEYLHVLNLTSQKGTITNEAGVFAIPVQVNDTLYVSALQFKDKTIAITEDLFSRKYISFYLEEEVNDLEEVDISNIDLTGRLGEDVSSVDTKKPFDPEAAGLPVNHNPIPTAEERRLYTATHTGGGIVPIDPIVNAITGKTKRLKKQLALSRMERKVQEARNIFEDSIYTRKLNIPILLVDDFAHYVYEDNDEALAMASRKNLLWLIELLEEKSVEYLELRKREEE